MKNLVKNLLWLKAAALKLCTWDMLLNMNESRKNTENCFNREPASEGRSAGEQKEEFNRTISLSPEYLRKYIYYINCQIIKVIFTDPGGI